MKTSVENHVILGRMFQNQSGCTLNANVDINSALISVLSKIDINVVFNIDFVEI